MLFRFKVSDGFFPVEFEGTQEAITMEVATLEIIEFYANELGTTENQIKIVELIEVKC